MFSQTLMLPVGLRSSTNRLADKNTLPWALGMPGMEVNCWKYVCFSSGVFVASPARVYVPCVLSQCVRIAGMHSRDF